VVEGEKNVKFSVIGLDHVNITTPEELEDEVLTWYRDVLGLSDVGKPSGARVAGGWLQAGGQQVHISIDPHNPPATAHYCLRVDDFEAAVSGMRAAGCHIEQARDLSGRRSFFTRDPAGNRIEIMSPEEDT
jgi:muramoyltetrapeptide carboxypeptidase